MIITHTYQITNIVCYFELPISACALCMNDPLWYTFTVEVGQQINQMEVLQQKRAILPNSLGALGICVGSGLALLRKELMVDAGLGKQKRLIEVQEIRHWYGREKHEMERNVTNH